MLWQIHHLAVNALLKSSQVDEMEGGSLFGYDHDMHSGSLAGDVNYDEASVCVHAFRVLSPLSKLHDPALHHLLHKVSCLLNSLANKIFKANMFKDFHIMLLNL